MNNILMNAPMTKAILDGRKVQTRRAIKHGLYAIQNDMNEHSIEVASNYCDLNENNHPELKSEMIKHAKYKKDEVIWVREPVRISEFTMWINNNIEEYDTKFLYLADNKFSQLLIPKVRGSAKKWLTHCQGIPNGCIKEMARIFLKVTDVRVERLQDMAHDDIFKEGYQDNGDFHMCSAGRDIKEHEWWKSLWNSTAPKGYKWEDNPYVFVYEFERV